MTKPQPKMNLIHQLILAGLSESLAGSRPHKVWDSEQGDVVTIQKPLTPAPRRGLAANVSEANLNAMAKRWAR
jgi:hypothetical protein